MCGTKHYDFDEIVERRQTNSVKWDLLGPVFGNPDLLPLWIADTDFRIPVEVEEALRRQLDTPLFGYGIKPRGFEASLADWLERRHGWRPREDSILPAQGVVRTLAEALNAFTDPGDPVLVFPPVYDPFFSTVTANNRTLQESPLVNEGGGRWRIDFDHLRTCFAAGTRALLFCNPHNPVGRVWEPDELKRLAELCLRYGVLVFSDDIHCDILRSGKRYTPLAAAAPELAEQLLTCYAPSKTFNLAGLKGSAVVIASDELRKRYKGYQARFHGGNMNAPAFAAFMAAYRHGDHYVDDLNRYLDANAAMLADHFRRRLPDYSFSVPEGTFLALCDCESLGLSSWDLVNHFKERAGILFSRGAAYGRETETCIRLNFGTTRKRLEEAVERLVSLK